MTSESQKLLPTFEKDSSTGSQYGDEANSLTSDHMKHRTTDGSMVNIFIAAEEGQCSHGSQEQDFKAENSDEKRNRKGSTCANELRCGICIVCSLLSGTVLLAIGYGLVVQYLNYTMSS